MNNKISFYILFAFLFIAFSCKSESKKEITKADIESVGENTNKNLESEYKSETKEVETEESDPIVVEKVENESPKEVMLPKKKEKKPKKVEGKEVENDKGVEDKNTGGTVNEPKEEVEVKVPDTEVKSEIEVKPDKPSKPERIEKFVGFPSHSVLDGLLKKHVSSSGTVDYKGLKSDESTLDTYITTLETNPPGTTWNRDQELAYWINAYNAFTIKLILKNYPIKSITDLHNGKPWDVKWIKLNGKTLSLNNIENDIIRPKYNEPRIHFAVNCAAKSCPPLLNGAYKAKTLDAQLESQTRKFINNPAYNNLSKNEIAVSKIFDWYGADFGDIASFIIGYTDKTIKPSAKVTYMEYNWDLNGK